MLTIALLAQVSQQIWGQVYQDPTSQPWRVQVIQVADGGPVNISNFPAVQGIQGWVVIDAGSQPLAVTGNFYPAVQPVSGTFFQSVQPVSQSGAWQGWVFVDGGTLAVSNFPASQAVTGTFWQATQPVSVAQSLNATGWMTADGGSVVVSNFPATQPVSIASMPSTPVTGTFWQTTQPVSIASMPSTPVTGTFWQSVQPVSGTFFQTVQPTQDFDAGQSLAIISNTVNYGGAIATVPFFIDGQSKLLPKCNAVRRSNCR